MITVPALTTSFIISTQRRFSKRNGNNNIKYNKYNILILGTEYDTIDGTIYFGKFESDVARNSIWGNVVIFKNRSYFKREKYKPAHSSRYLNVF